MPQEGFLKNGRACGNPYGLPGIHIPFNAPDMQSYPVKRLMEIGLKDVQSSHPVRFNELKR